MFQVAEVCTVIAGAIADTAELFVRVKRVISLREFEVQYSEVPVTVDEFLPEGIDLAKDDREKLLLRLQFATAPDRYVFRLATAVRELLSAGIPLAFGDSPVSNVVIVRTVALDVSDLLGDYDILLRDASSDASISTYATFRNTDKLRALGPKVAMRLGLQEPSIEVNEKNVRLVDAETNVPHCWLAAIVDPPKIDGYAPTATARMVHIDVCGIAYDKTAVVRHNGKLASFKSFVTPAYELAQMSDDCEDHKFELMPFVVMPPLPGKSVGKSSVVKQPHHVRHFRSLSREGGSLIEVMPLDEFMSRQSSTLPDMFVKRVASIRDQFMHLAPPLSTVQIQHLEKRPELNGRSGRVCPVSPSSQNTGRIAIEVKGEEAPVLLRPSCIVISSKPQYLSLQDMKKNSENSKESTPEADAKRESARKKKIGSLSALDRILIADALNEDEDIKEAYGMVCTGKMKISSFGEESVMKGMRRILTQPLRTLLLEEQAKRFDKALMIADHPRSKEVFEIVKMTTKAKQDLEQERKSSRQQGLGGVPFDKESQLYRLSEKISARISADEELTRVFARMDSMGLFPSPVKQWELLNSS